MLGNHCRVFMVLLGAASLCAALEDGYYRIRSRPNSGACLDHYLYKGRRLLRIKSACSMADSQMFYLMKKPNGAFIVMTADFYPEEKTQCLAPLKDNNIDRDRHVYYFRDCGDSISQMFGDVQLQHYFVRESNGFYEIRNFAGDRSMDMGRDREWLKMHPRKNVDNQDWKVEAMYGSKNPLCNPGHYFDKTSLLCEPVRERYYSRRFASFNAAPEKCADKFYSEPGSTGCVPVATCPVGTYSPDPNFPTCIACGNAEVSKDDRSGCDWCGTIMTGGALSVSDKDPTKYHFESVDGTVCRCVDGYIGERCDSLICPAMVPRLSLLSILFASDDRLRHATLTFSPNPDSIDVVSRYLSDLLSLVADENGDKSLSVDEVSRALKYRNVALNSSAYHVWCTNDNDVPLIHACVNDVELTVVFDYAMNCFLSSPNHNFDCSGIPFVKSLNASYPEPDWSNEQCASINTYSGTDDDNEAENMVVWEYVSDFDPAKNVSLMCGYTNGVLEEFYSEETGTSDHLGGLTTNFVDDMLSTSQYKRVNCVFVRYVDGSGLEKAAYQCSLGLLADGTPLNLQPELTTNGVIFSFFDTSTSEYQFDILVGEPEPKNLAVSIYAQSLGCGRTLRPISFADQESAAHVGRVKEYSIRALQQIKEGGTVKEVASAVTSFPYRIPFLATVEGQVTTTSGVGVPRVEISFCHIDYESGAPASAESGHCPFPAFITDQEGYYSGEIRVSDASWHRSRELFTITPSFVEEHDDGNFTEHVFDPPGPVSVTLNHLKPYTMNFLDKTAISIIGNVIFYPGLTGEHICPSKLVRIKMTDAFDIEFEADTESDGTFAFSSSRMESFTIFVPSHLNHTFIFELSALGRPLVDGTHYSVADNAITVFGKTVVSDIVVTFVDTSSQLISLDVVGGLMEQYNIFGDETVLKVSAADSEFCGFTFEASMSEGGNISTYYAIVAAMPYVVEIKTTATFQPVFQKQKRITNDPNFVENPVYCAESLSPMDYFTKTGQLSQPLDITYYYPDDAYNVVFIYRSGVCIEIVGAGQFSTDIGTGDGTQACYSEFARTLETGFSQRLEMILYEKYSEEKLSSYKNAANNEKSIIIESFVQENYVPNAQLQIFDQVGGFNSLQKIDYNINGTNEYVVTAGEPNVLFPFAWIFQAAAVVSSNGAELYHVSSVDFYIPVLGSKTKEVPNFYPVPSDPTMIFLVLRDPPGSESYTTFHSGTAIDLSLSVGSMRTFSATAGGKLKFQKGKITDETLCKGYGVLVCSNLAASELSHVTTFEYKPSTSQSRASNTAYDYTMKFGYDIKTSTNPMLAGHASDVIVGGGIDLIVNEAILVYQTEDAPEGKVCFSERDTNEWQPGRLTTYVLAVYEIEDLVQKLEEKIIDLELDPKYEGDNVDKENLKIQVENWNTVLRKYRKHNGDHTAMLSAQIAQFNDMTNAFSTFQDSQRDIDWDFVWQRFRGNYFSMGGGLMNALSVKAFPANLFFKALADSAVGAMALSFYGLFRISMDEAMSQCINVVPGYTNRVQSRICKDFDANKWKDFWSAVSNSCDMLGNPTSDTRIGELPIAQSLCESRRAGENLFENVPGGLLESGESIEDFDMFSFLKDQKRLITFGAQTTFSMDFTSTVSDSVATSLDLKHEVPGLSTKGGFENKFSLFKVNVKAELELGFKMKEQISVSKTHSQSKSFERTVSIKLGDKDQGDYFAIGITEDQVYGTPIFTMIGGQSRCPGETMTTKRESEVKITRLVHKCGSDRNSSCTGLKVGENAIFGLQVQNLSPSEDEVYYTLRFPDTYDYYLPSSSTSARRCGDTGYKTGLAFRFSQTDFRRLPYKQNVEVDIIIANVMAGHCNNYLRVPLEFVATCEIPSTYNFGVRQYGVIFNETTLTQEISYDPGLRITEPLGDTVHFDVSWNLKQTVEAPSRNLVEEMLANMTKKLDASIVQSSDDTSIAVQSSMASISSAINEDLSVCSENSDFLFWNLFFLGILIFLIILLIAAQFRLYGEIKKKEDKVVEKGYKATPTEDETTDVATVGASGAQI